jgi:hypothetical protein
MQSNTIEHERFQTPHYTFIAEKTLRVNQQNIPISWHYLIGDKKRPCLSLFFYCDTAISSIPPQILSTANLSNIEALDTCIETTVSTNTSPNVSFGYELLNAIVIHLREKFPYIKQLKLSDASYIPCDIRTNDTVDLLSYSIAHYGKTWYERYFHAYTMPNSAYTTYRKKVDVYMSSEFKKSLPWNTFYALYLMACTRYTYEFIQSHIDEIQLLYNDATTFPEFFISLTAMLPKHEKCKFYKFWLEQFISSTVGYTREWILPIYQVGGKRIRVRKTQRKYL